MTDDPLASVVFVDVPEQVAGAHPDLFPAGGVAIPVETGAAQPDFQITDLSDEMIIAGMLRVLAHRPEHEHAATYRRFVTAVRPSIVDELTSSGVERAREGDLEPAEEMFRALAGLAPGRAEGLINLAIVLDQRASRIERDEPDEAGALRQEAFRAYRRVLSSGEALPPLIVFNAGMFFLNLQNSDAAAETLRRFLAETDTLPDFAEERRQAEETLRRIDRQRSLNALFEEAYDFVRIGEEERGIERITEFLDRMPEAWNAWFLLGWAQRRLARFEEASRAFDRAVELGGDNADTWNELSICRMETGDFRGARAALRNALEREPENVKIMSNFGVVALREGNRDEARRFFESVLEYDPEDPVARKYLAELDGA